MKKSKLAIIFLIFWANIFSSNLVAQKKDFARINAENREKLRQILTKEDVPGASIAVSVDGKTIWNEAFGLANIETNSSATIATKFGIGSISKSLTAVLAMRLVEDGLLNLDAPIEKYLPDYPHQKQGVTVRLILSHLSGYADNFDDANFYNTKRYENTEQVLREFYKESLTAKPHEKSIYGTTTFTLIAAVVEKITKRDFATAMSDFVLKPLQIKDILPNDRQAIIPNRTAFYIKNEAGKIVNGEFVDSSFKLAGAGFLATAGDLAKFGAALTNEEFLKKKSLDELFQPMATATGEKTPFALGFRVTKMADGVEIIHQPGGGVGISSVLLIDRQRKISIAILSNRTFAPIGDPAKLREIADSYGK